MLPLEIMLNGIVLPLEITKLKVIGIVRSFYPISWVVAYLENLDTSFIWRSRTKIREVLCHIEKSSVFLQNRANLTGRSGM